MRCGSRNDASPHDHVHAVAGELVLNDLPLRLADVADHQPQVVHRDFSFAAIAFFVDVAMTIAGEVHNGFANGLRGDRAGMERDAAQQFLSPFDDEHAPILLGGGDGCFLSGRAAAHYNQVVSHAAVFRFGDSCHGPQSWRKQNRNLREYANLADRGSDRATMSHMKRDAASRRAVYRD